MAATPAPATTALSAVRKKHVLQVNAAPTQTARRMNFANSKPAHVEAKGSARRSPTPPTARTPSLFAAVMETTTPAHATRRSKV